MLAYNTFQTRSSLSNDRMHSHKSGNAYEQQLTKHDEATNYFQRNLKLFSCRKITKKETNKRDAKEN